MKIGFSHHVVSYAGGGDDAESNLDTVLAGASTFEPSDVEVLYKVHGGTLLHCKERARNFYSFIRIDGIPFGYFA